LVEDNPGDADLIQEILADSISMRILFTLADRLEAAFQILENTQVDLILLDLGLPDSNGLETVKKMFEVAESVPIIVLTGHDDRQMALAAVKVGAQDYLVKGKIAVDVFERVIRYSLERHRNRQRVKESEQFLRATLDALAAHIAILDHTGRILSVNKAWVDFAKQNNADLESIGAGVNYFDVCEAANGEDVVTAAAVTAGIRAVISGDLNVFQIEYPCHSPAEQRWFHLGVTPFPGTSKRQVVVAHENITARKQADNALISSENRIRLVFDTSPNCLFIKDKAGRYVMVNKATARLFNTTSEEMIGKTDDQIGAGSWGRDTTKSWQDLNLATDNNRIQPTNEEAFLQHDGTTQWFRTFRAPIAFADFPDCELTIAVDITLQREAREKLRSSQLLLRIILDTLTSRVILMDRELRIIWANRTATEYAKKGNDQFIGLPCYDIFHHQNEPCQHCPAVQAINQGRLSEQVAKTSHGRTWVTYAIPIRNDLGEIANVVEVADDITDRMALEGKLRQAQKMESLGTLAGGIAHDFNNILSGVLGYTELAKGRAEDRTLKEYLDEVFSAGLRATELVRQILTFSRRRNTELQPLQVPLVVKEALKLLRSTLPTTVELKTQIAREVDPVLADPTQIHQIIMNLCTNASHAMEPDGGVLTITIEQITPEPRFFEKHLDLTPGSFLRLRVSDTGCGMAPDIIASIFDPYFTTKDLGEGTGLGLAVVHGIIKGYGGEILVDSTPGHGSTFTILLPVTAKDVFDLNPETDSQGGSERILLVEDEPVLSTLYQKFLEQAGYRVTTFNNSQKALDGFRETPHDFDLVLSDVTMPRLTGDKMGLQMMAIRPELPVVLMTGFSQHLNEELVEAQGFRGLLHKPLVKNSLLLKLREILDNPQKHY
jgi:PAS domain S-box-containing protein